MLTNIKFYAKVQFLANNLYFLIKICLEIIKWLQNFYFWVYFQNNSIFLKKRMIILSNRKWFKTYIIARQTLLFFIILGFFLTFVDMGFWGRFYNAITFPLLLVLLLFEYVENPALFEIEKHDGNSLVFKLFAPNKGILYIFSEKKVKNLEISSKDKISVQISQNELPFLTIKKCFFLINKGTNSSIRTAKIGLGWADESTISEIKKIVAQHNQGI